jgi:hypothetical protein
VFGGRADSEISRGREVAARVFSSDDSQGASPIDRGMRIPLLEQVPVMSAESEGDG